MPPGPQSGRRGEVACHSRISLLLVLYLLAAASRSLPAADRDDSRPAETPAPFPLRVLFIVEKDCDRCEKELARLQKPGGDFQAMRSRGWKIGESPDNHLQIVDRETVAELIEELAIREYPTVACVNNEKEIVRSFKEGCTTPLDAWTFGWLLNGKNERPRAVVPEPIRAKTTGSYPLRGNHWSVDGDWRPAHERLVGHLRGPNHGSQIAASWTIETWSYEELRSLHDDLHERELASGSGVVSASYSAPGAYYAPVIEHPAARASQRCRP